MRLNPEVVQKWFLNRWKITAGLRVSPIDHNQFPFDLPSGRKLSEQRLGLVLEWKNTIAGVVVSLTGFEVK